MRATKLSPQWTVLPCPQGGKKNTASSISWLKATILLSLLPSNTPLESISAQTKLHGCWSICIFHICCHTPAAIKHIHTHAWTDACTHKRCIDLSFRAHTYALYPNHFSHTSHTHRRLCHQAACKSMMSSFYSSKTPVARWNTHAHTHSCTYCRLRDELLNEIHLY